MNGAVYTRWGTGSCPAGHDEVYAGVMAGSMEGRGGGAQYICLTDTPTFQTFSPSNENGVDIYPVEYRGDPLKPPTDPALQNLAALCATCLAPNQPWSLIIPGRNDCPSSFQLAYAGYLMAEKRTARGRTSFVCVDEGAEGVPDATNTADDAAGLYPTEAAGGIPSYVDNVEITCATCTSASGPTYVRWGRSDCATHATLVYAGYAAAGHHYHTGSGYNMQCLHSSPLVNQFDSNYNPKTASLHPVEYGTYHTGLWKLWPLNDHEVPCAVCQSTGSVGVHMQPGNSICALGWSSEYIGYILSINRFGAQDRSQKSDYVCVDEHAQPSPASDPSNNGDRSFQPHHHQGLATSLEPVEVYETPAGNGNSFFGHARFSELMCAVCSNPVDTCPDLIAPGNGTIVCDNSFMFGSRCTATCNFGFSPVPKEAGFTVCTAAGWSADLPSCSPEPIARADSYMKVGSKTCSSEDEVLYAGRLAGAAKHDPGSGSNYLCMPPTSTSDGTNVDPDTGGFLWSVEYQTQQYPASSPNFNGFDRINGANSYEVPCVMCARKYVTAFDVWGTRTCPLLAERAYSGYMMADSSQRTEFTCVDEHFDKATYDNTRNDDATVSLIESYRYSQLDGVAPGYHDDMELTCAKCVFTNSPGQVYSRWGSTECPDGRNTLYAGVMTGTYSAGHGGSSTYVCLAPDMQLKEFAEGSQLATDSHLFRVQMRDNNALRVMAGKDYKDVLCTVCQAAGEYQIMIPGTVECPARFHVDYAGYLLSERGFNSNRRSEFVCVDSAMAVEQDLAVPQAINVPAGELWSTEADKHINGYVEDLEITCAACSSNEGPLYVRWGRKVCPDDATLLYSGQTAGASWNDAGSGSNYICMHPQPEYTDWDPRTNGAASGAAPGGARLFPTEYAFGTPAQLADLWSLDTKYVPCAVCQSRGAMATFMQPGSTVCPTGWASEYNGYIMSAPGSGVSDGVRALSSGYRSKYVCVDKAATATCGADECTTAIEGDGGDLDSQTSYRGYRSLMMPVEVQDQSVQDTTGGNSLGAGLVVGTEIMCSVCALPLPITIDKLRVYSDNEYDDQLATIQDSIRVKFSTSRSVNLPRVIILGRNATVAGAGNSYVASVTVEDTDPQGPVEFLVTELMDSEIEGNSGEDVSEPTDGSSVTVDSIPPVVKMASIFSDSDFDNQTSVYDTKITCEFNTSEIIQRPGVAFSGIGTFVGSSDSMHFRAVLTASAALPDGPVALLIQYRDLAGNVGSDLVDTTDGSRVVHDSNPPVIISVSLSNDAPDPTQATNGDLLTIAFMTSEAILYPSVQVAGVYAPVVAGSVPFTFTATVECASGMEEGLAAIHIEVVDVAGQRGNASSTSDGTYTVVDLQEPVLTIAAADAFTTVGKTMAVSRADPLIFEFSLSDPAVDFTEIDVFLTPCADPNGCCNPVFTALSATLYTLACDARDGHSISVDVQQQSFTNPAGFQNTIPSKFTILSDTTAPAVSATLVANNPNDPGLARFADTLTLEFTASEPVYYPSCTILGAAVQITRQSSDMPVVIAVPGGAVVGGVAVSSLVVPDAGRNYVSTYTISAADPDGFVSLSIELADLANNVVSISSFPTISVRVDATIPQVAAQVISSNSDPTLAVLHDRILISLVLSEHVTDVSVALGQQDVPMSSIGNTWTGEVAVTALPVDTTISIACADSAGNQCVASRDTDGDGIPNSVEGAADNDGDGYANSEDVDSDGDGIADGVEGTTDADSDGIPSFLDIDSDGDGVLDATEGTGDPDNDGTPSYLDLDSDGDSVLDIDDIAYELRVDNIQPAVTLATLHGTFDPTASFVVPGEVVELSFVTSEPTVLPRVRVFGHYVTAASDPTDALRYFATYTVSVDDIGSVVDTFHIEPVVDLNGNAALEPTRESTDGLDIIVVVDTDGDLIADQVDDDDDDDGVVDVEDAFPLDPTEVLDTDFDGIGNSADADDDGDGTDDDADAFPLDPTENIDSDQDGVGNNADAFPLDPTETVDTDGDQIGDTRDPDDDGDDVDDPADKYPLDPTETTDSDGDAIGDTADMNDDDDAVLDPFDAFPLDPTETRDSDGDGIGNEKDVRSAPMPSIAFQF